MTFYGQNGEDRWLHEHWDELGLPERGTFAEVGVGSGKHISNTAWLEESKGWAGILIEPDPRHHESIRKLRRSPLVPVAIGQHIRPFRLDPNPELSGFRRTEGELIDVPVMSLTDVLLDAGILYLDLLSIDTEGTELEVWETLELDVYRPKVVVMEWFSAGIDGDLKAAIVERMTTDGYQLLAELGCNLIFKDRA
jgi:FkbM family methyltransferase